MQLNKRNLEKLIGVLQTLYKKMNDKEVINVDLKSYLNNTGDFTLPRQWVIKQNTSKDVCEWFRTKGLFSAAVTGNFRYLACDSRELSYTLINDLEDTEYIEITEEQFNKYVLNKK